MATTETDTILLNAKLFLAGSALTLAALAHFAPAGLRAAESGAEDKAAKPGRTTLHDVIARVLERNTTLEALVKKDSKPGFYARSMSMQPLTIPVAKKKETQTAVRALALDLSSAWCLEASVAKHLPGGGMEPAVTDILHGLSLGNRATDAAACEAMTGPFSLEPADPDYQKSFDQSLTPNPSIRNAWLLTYDNGKVYLIEASPTGWLIKQEDQVLFGAGIINGKRIEPATGKIRSGK